MVRKVLFDNSREIKKVLPNLENIFKIRFFLRNKTLFLKGDEYEEFVAEKVIRALDFGFNLKEALLLRNEDYDFRIINIKNYVRPSRLLDVKGRIIGKKGKAKKVMEEISGAIIKLKRNEVGIIADSEHLEELTSALISLIEGTKHSNIFHYLENVNTRIKTRRYEDLGLKNKFLN